MANAQMLWGGKSTRNAIVDALTLQWPLSLKQIYHEIKHNGKISVTYQAVHKTVQWLKDEHIVDAVGKQYQLDHDWITNLAQFSRQLEAGYGKYNRNDLTHQTSFTFETLYEVDMFLVELMEKQIMSQKQKELLCLHWSHFWVPLFLSRAAYRKIKKITQFVDGYFLSRGNTPVDRWCASFWRKHAMKLKTGCDVAGTSDLLVYKNFIIEVFYPKDIMERIDRIFARANKVSDIDLNRFFEDVFEQKTNIPVLIHENPTLAGQLRKQTLRYFTSHSTR